MLALPLSVLIASCPCCPAFEPWAPYTTRAVESGWGESVRGLSILATTDRDTIPLGGEMRVEVFLRFNHFESDGRVGYLDPDRRLERIMLQLVNPGTGRTQSRRPFDIGMYCVMPREIQELPYGPVGARAELFHLLSGHGEQVPTGDYDAYLTYAGVPPRRKENDDRPDLRDEVPAGSLWEGVVRTAPFRIHVAAREADTTWTTLPRSIVFEEILPGDIFWTWDPDSFEPVALVSRPGYHLGSETKVYRTVDAPDPADSTLLEEDRRVHSAMAARLGSEMTVRGGIPQPGRGHVFFATRSDMRQSIAAGRSLRLELHMTIFETSEPNRHMWRPQSGEYRVLLQRRITATYP